MIATKLMYLHKCRVSKKEAKLQWNSHSSLELLFPYKFKFNDEPFQRYMNPFRITWKDKIAVFHQNPKLQMDIQIQILHS